MKQLLQKLLTIQKAVDGIAKSEQGFNYSYAGQEQVLNTIRPLMNDQGLLLMQEVLEVENTRIDYKLSSGKEKSEILTSAKQKSTWYDVETGDKLEALFHANGMNDWEKGLGSALTYAERYFLLKFFHIPTPADDPDSRQVQPPTQGLEKVFKTITDGAQNEIDKLNKAPVEAPKLNPKVETDIIKCNTLEELERFYMAFSPEEKELYKNVVSDHKLKLVKNQKK